MQHMLVAQEPKPNTLFKSASKVKVSHIYAWDATTQGNIVRRLKGVNCGAVLLAGTNADTHYVMQKS